MPPAKFWQACRTRRFYHFVQSSATSGLDVAVQRKSVPLEATFVDVLVLALFADLVRCCYQVLVEPDVGFEQCEAACMVCWIPDAPALRV